MMLYKDDMDYYKVKIKIETENGELFCYYHYLEYTILHIILSFTKLEAMYAYRVSALLVCDSGSRSLNFILIYIVGRGHDKCTLVY